MQPRRNAGLQSIWAQASRIGGRPLRRHAYCNALSPHLRVPVKKPSLAAHSTDVAVLKLTIGDEIAPFRALVWHEFNDFLGSIARKASHRFAWQRAIDT